MPKVIINRERCKGCQLCLIYCPKELIKKDKTLNKKGIQPMVFLAGGCSGCKSCAVICPEEAVEIYK